jgi:hypothetical protein
MSCNIHVATTDEIEKQGTQHNDIALHTYMATMEEDFGTHVHTYIRAKE